MKTVALYDHEKCIELLMNQNGWSYSEAVEHLDYNVAGSYVGEYTPVFATLFTKPE